MCAVAVEPMQYGLAGGRKVLLAAVALIALLVGGRSAFVWWQHRAPYGPGAVQAKVSLQLYPPLQAQAVLDQLTGGHVLSVDMGDGSGTGHEVVGRLDLTRPAHAPSDALYYLFLTDDRNGGRPLANLWARVGGADAASGWDGRLAAIPHRYSALHGLADVPVGGGWTPGEAVSWRSGQPGPVVFTGLVDEQDGPAASVLPHLSAVLAMFSPDMHLYWAEKLPVS